jgi:hypothetical protein
LKGDEIDPRQVTHINLPQGSISDPEARIWPFKINLGKQPYDVKHKYLLIPKLAGEGGYWSEFDWHKAATLGAAVSGLAFSGELGFAETDMYWSLSHMIAPKERALQCTDCHGERGRMDWAALGYQADPAFTGGRRHQRLVRTATEGGR